MTYHTAAADIALRDQSITERVFENLETRPDEVILTDGMTGTAMTAAEFMGQVKALAGGLTARGFGAGKTVALMSPNVPHYCVVFHAVAWAGGTVTTINPTYTAAEVTHQLKDSDADILITIPMSHRNLVVNVDQVIEGGDVRAGEVAAAFLPFFHIYGMNVLMNVHLAGGGALVTMPRFDLELFLQISQDHKARRMWIVPPVALALAKHPIVDNYDLSSVEQIFSGAAPLGAEVSDAVAKRLNCISLQGFGMTELSPVSHTTPQDRPKSGSSGTALPNTTCRIVDPESGEDLPAGSEGELWIKGPQVMQGYLNNEKATAETLTPDGWLKTGDIAYIDDEGYMFIVDRLKELIKFKGFQVAPAELEATLNAHDGIIDAAVIGLPDDEAGELPVAYVVVGDPAPSEDEIKAHLAKTLSSYKQVHSVHFVDEIPKSASGKILRRVLKAQAMA